MGNWSKVPGLQIAASLEKMAWQERKHLINSALKKFDRAFGGADFFKKSLCVLEALRGLLGFYDLPVLGFFPPFLSPHIFLIISVRIFLLFSTSLEAICCEDIDLFFLLYDRHYH